MGVENLRVDPLFDPETRYGEDAYEVTDRGRPSALDSPEARREHQQLLGYYAYERNRQAANRWQMALDGDYYDGLQLDDEDLQELANRGQAPLVYNLVARTVNWVIGTEKRTRFDWKIHGRTKDDVEPARVKTDAMKYHSDVNLAPFHRSAAFKEAVISGVGWLETGARKDPFEEPVYTRADSWWFNLHDSHSTEIDYTDARYHFRTKWVDEDVAKAMFEGRERVIAADASSSDIVDERAADMWYLGSRLAGEDYASVGAMGRYNHGQFGMVDTSRGRVRLYEAWHRKPTKDRVLRSRLLPDMHGQLYDVNNDDMRHALIIGDATVFDRVHMAVYCSIFTDAGMLFRGRSPYRHNRFPFTPIWCYRRQRDGMPYGMIRNIRDPQDGFNKRMSKAIFALSAYRVTADSDAIDTKTQTWEDLRDEAGRPDALIVKKRGTSIEVAQDRALGEEHLKLAQTEGSLILDASGVTADNLGMESNAQSGKAILAKQAEGSAVTAEIFDNLRLAAQLHGQKELSNLEQFWTEEKVIRVTDTKGRPTWKKINEITTLPNGETRVLNDITAAKADFIVDQQDFHASRRQAASEALMEMAGKMGTSPELALRIVRFAVDMGDYPNKDELVKELDKITGYSDPADAMTPEEQAQQQQAAQAQQAQQKQQAEQQSAAFQAELAVKRADAEKKLAEAEKIRVEAGEATQRIDAQRLAGQNVDAVQAAVADVTAQAEATISELNRTIAELEARANDAEAERLVKREIELGKADRDKEARVEVARISAPPPAPMSDDHANLMADLTQEVMGLAEAMAEITKRVEESKAEREKERKDEEREREERKKAEEALLKKVEQAAKDAVLEAERREPKEAQAPVVNVTIEKGAVQVDNNIEAPKPGGKKITISPDGREATVEPKKE